jgi:hypothetical protein
MNVNYKINNKLILFIICTNEWIKQNFKYESPPGLKKFLTEKTSSACTFDLSFLG